MKTYLVLLTCFFFNLSETGFAQDATPRINTEKDLLLVQYDCKTDVDDLHSVAAFRTILNSQKFSGLKYYAVAGTYGIQEGLYVPPNELFQLTFGTNWADAHSNFNKAVDQVKEKVITTLNSGGDVWIAEAGQSDFTAALLKAVQSENAEINTSKRFHVVQHSDWNESVTTSELLSFVKANTDYHKIADGNVVGNGTPGFRSEKVTGWKENIKSSDLINVWHLAIQLGIQYNGKEGRYNNEAVAAGGLDFSDTAEVCWILGLENLHDAEAFFQYFGN